MKRLLVICEGNICRSPMAMGLFAAALPTIEVVSAGLNALVGMAADPAAVSLMRARGLDISEHRAIQLNRELCARADLVLAMSTEQRKEVERRYPTSHGRVFRIGEFSGYDVPDPYRQSRAAFEQSLKVIDESALPWMHRINQI
jgi:protein-tyrosine phosphatase